MNLELKEIEQTVLIETQYLPSLAAFAHMIKGRPLVIEACENYQKRSFRNRAYIAGAGGVQRLSIPLEKGKNHRTPVKEVRLSNAYDWRSQHRHALRSAYGRAPFFEHFMPELEDLFFNQKIKFLLDFNIALLERIIHWLDMDVPVVKSEVFETHPNGMDLRNRFLPGEANDKESFPPYYQVFSDKNGFISGLSIVDLIFNVGPEAVSYLKALPGPDFED